MTTETHIHESDEILSADDLYDLVENANNLVPVRYRLTSGELGWLDFVRGRYSIADYVSDNLDDDKVLTFQSDALSRALHDDNGDCCFAACLSEDTALAKIIFWCYQEPELCE